MENVPINMIFAANIKRAMDRSGTNASQLARDAKLNQTAIYDILKGKSANPRLDTVSKIAMALNLPVESLLREREDSEIEIEILNALADLNQEDQARFLAVARAMIAKP